MRLSKILSDFLCHKCGLHGGEAWEIRLWARQGSWTRGHPPGRVGLGVALLWPRGRSQAGLRSTSGWSHRGASFNFLSFEDRGSVAHLPSALSLGSHLARRLEGPTAESRRASPGLHPSTRVHTRSVGAECE